MGNILQNILKDKTLLILEDDETTSEIMFEILKKYFNKVITGKNGAEGLNLVANETVDCIICDIAMPLMDGITFHQHLSQTELRSIPFLFLSAHQDIDYAQRLGIPAISKPASLNSLQEVLMQEFADAKA